MKWFGERRFAPICDDMDCAATPVDQLCAHCDEAIQQGDDGFLIPTLLGGEYPYHYVCHMRAIIGGVNHLKGICTCCGGDQEPDPPGLSRYQAAQAAVHYYEQRRVLRREKV